ncbi:MAG: YajQ family cyclic di-GMP-binding protein [Acidobacteria bacterium]|nr:YajQ family cyclic di-GMP-binding protein [Acidobacteriota bacterium]MCI0626119.1 YajQ family cyclic di-GMP-binding protein [Acidobacteriota bacterium]MCI0723559.1 YajQ family cyclic di-GMP-binding protein [Acidobacteriota bacterium]
MAAQNTFDIVSKIEMQEVDNAINQAMKEVVARFDFKGSKSKIHLEGKDKLILISDDEFKLKSLNDIFQQKLVKRGISLKSLSYKKPVPSAESTVRQEVDLQQGITTEKAKEVVKIIKDSKLKVQASINGDFVRVSGKDRDTLQEVIKMLKSREFDFDMQFTNYRSQ